MSYFEKGILIIIALSLTLFAYRQIEENENDLEIGFKNPPKTVRPWVYWYWYSDNVSINGVEKDLKAMSEAGIGTALIGSVAYGGKTGDIKALSDEWWDVVKFAIKEAGKYDINIGMFNCPGWSQSGGPWIKPEQAMRYLKSNEIKVSGAQKIDIRLTDPDSVFQDVVLLAYPAPKFDGQFVNNSIAVISGSSVSNDIKNVIDGNKKTVFEFPQKAIDENRYVIDIKTSKKVQTRSLSFYPAPVNFRVSCELQVKNKNGLFEKIKKFDIYRAHKDIMVGPMFDAPTTISFPEIKASQFRLIFTDFAFHPFKGKYTSLPGIAEVEISSAAKLERFVEKQLGRMFWMPMPMWDDYLWDKPTEAELNDLVITSSQVRDISKFLKEDGNLNWDVPAGDWIIQRISMVPTGAKNAPVLKEAEGYEVDKMRKDLAEYHFNSYVGKLIREMPQEDRTALKYLVIDSYEQGSQNWTDDMRDKFIARYSYDPLIWLPVLSGRIIESADKSERILWDLRRLVADRVSFDYAGGLREIANKNGLKLWMENYGHWGFPGEFLQYGGQSDVDAGEFWATGELGSIEQKAAASAAHIYGQKVTCAESFTSGPPNFVYHPWSFKKRGDWSFTEGINQTLLHVYIQQPYDDKIPGVNAPFGSAFNRHNTWFKSMDSWIKYLQRANFMLQQGNFVADVAYFIGEDVPKMTGTRDPELPLGYSYDYINADVIMNRLSIEDGRFVLPDGMSYKVLVLPKLETMRPELLTKIKELIAAGGIVYGPKPLRSPSMENYPQADKLVAQTADEIWQKCDGVNKKDVVYGQGRIFNGNDLRTVFSKIDLLPDVDKIKNDDILWIHRRVDDKEIYFLTNQTAAKVETTPIFRVINKIPELWDGVSGKIRKTAVYESSKSGTAVYLNLSPYESVFVVFRDKLSGPKPVKQIKNGKSDTAIYAVVNGYNVTEALIGENGLYIVQLSDGDEKEITVNTIPDPIRISGLWELNFESGKDVPQKITINSLKSWTEFENEAIKYYSGSVIYKKNVNISAEFLNSADETILSLGEVGLITEVTINGKYLGDFWQPPFDIDIGKAIKAGENSIEIKVTNLWQNRLIGDAKYPDGFPGTKQEFKPWLSYDIGINKNEEPIKSGLIGNVTIKALKRVEI